MTFLEDLLTPSSRQERPVSFAAFALGHAVIGAAAADLLGVEWAWLFVIAYAAVKEGWDLRHGGSLGDSFADALFVCLGAYVVAPGLWLLLAVVTSIGREVLR